MNNKKIKSGDFIRPVDNFRYFNDVNISISKNKIYKVLDCKLIKKHFPNKILGIIIRDNFGELQVMYPNDVIKVEGNKKTLKVLYE